LVLSILYVLGLLLFLLLLVFGLIMKNKKMMLVGVIMLIAASGCASVPMSEGRVSVEVYRVASSGDIALSFSYSP